MPDASFDFAAWLARHFPKRGGIERAAEFLGKSRRSVERMRDGSPVMRPTARKCGELDDNPELLRQHGETR